MQRNWFNIRQKCFLAPATTGQSHVSCLVSRLKAVAIRSGQLSLTYREWTPAALSSPAAKTFSGFIPVIGSPARLGSVVLRSA